MRIYIWGTGGVASDYLETNEIKKDELEGFIESKRRRDTFRGKKVYEPCELTGIRIMKQDICCSMDIL